MKSKFWLRLICLALCMAVLLPCVTSVAEKKKETTKVATYLLRLREKPSTSARVLDAYPRGTKVTILKKGTEWTRVSVRGKTGYMQTDKLAYGRAAAKKQATAAKTTTKKAVATGDTAYIIKGVRLNLREAANTSSEIIASFRGGTKVTILKKGKHWSFVEVKGLQGYMSTDYLTSEKEK